MNVAMLVQAPIDWLLSRAFPHGVITRPTPIVSCYGDRAADHRSYPQAEGEAVSNVAEVAEILATGIVRLRQRHGSAAQSSRFARERGESSLDCRANQSGHVGTKSNRRAAQ